MASRKWFHATIICRQVSLMPLWGSERHFPVFFRWGTPRGKTGKGRRLSHPRKASSTAKTKRRGQEPNNRSKYGKNGRFSNRRCNDAVGDVALAVGIDRKIRRTILCSK
jgi:hypothetical protein